MLTRTFSRDQKTKEEITLDQRVDDMMMKVGGCGCFQVLAYLAIGFGMTAPGWFIYEEGFLTQPATVYLCECIEGYT